MSASPLASAVLASTPGSERWRATVASLCAAALSADTAEAAAATRALFAEIVEPWSDLFETEASDQYLEFMAEGLFACGGRVRATLKKLGYREPGDLTARTLRFRRPVRVSGPADCVRKVFVLSRVTLGADIAVAGIVLKAAKQAFPTAAIEFVGDAKNASLFAADTSIRLLSTSYRRGALLADRLDAWLTLRDALSAATAGLRPEEYLILDPDSRLTQLGLLPIAGDESRYRFFDSRCYGQDSQASLGELTADWLREVLPLPAEPTLHPWVALSKSDLERGRQLRSASNKPLAAVSFGVGGRESKRLSDDFEDCFLALLKRAGFRVVLDFGAAPSEEQNALDRRAAFQGSTAAWPARDADLVTWKGSLAAFGGLIAAADIYVGYDSASVHLASALGVPLVDVFVDAASERMRQRWTPGGPGKVTVVPVGRDRDESQVLRAVAEALPR